MRAVKNQSFKIALALVVGLALVPGAAVQAFQPIKVIPDYKASFSSHSAEFQSASSKPAFTCDSSIYQVMGSTSSVTLRKLNPNLGTYTQIGESYDGTYNALAYNPADNFLYAVTGTHEVIRVYSNGATESTSYSLPTLAAGTYNSGYFLEPNVLVVSFNSTNWRTVDVTTGAVRNITISPSMDPSPTGDMVVLGGKIYAVSYYESKLFTITPSSSSDTWTQTSVDTNLPKSSRTGENRVIWGAAFSNELGELFVSLNLNGNIYQIKNFTTASPTASLIITGNTGPQANNDGANCPGGDETFKTVANPDATFGKQDVVQTIDLSANDVATNTSPLVPTSVRICLDGEALGSCSATSLDVERVGIYTLDTPTGVISFAPVTGFTGSAAPITYSIADSVGGVATSTYQPTVVPPPIATSDTSTGPINTPQTRSVLDNDAAGAAGTLDVTRVKLCKTDETADIAPDCTLTTLTVANQGTYTVNPTNGSITFTPLPTFTGTATAVVYSVTDLLGQKASASYTPTVEAPPAPPAPAAPAKPVALNDSSTGIVNQVQTLNLLTNDSSPDGYPITAASTALCSLDPAETPPTCSATTVVIPGEGTLTISNGVVTFTPDQDFFGAVTPVPYVIVNSSGEKAHALINITVTATPVLEEEPVTVVEAEEPIAELAETGFSNLQLSIGGFILLLFGAVLMAGSRLARVRKTTV